MNHWIAIAHLDAESVHKLEQHTPVLYPKVPPSIVTARSAAEFVIGQIFHLARQLPHQRRFEVRNKTLGIIGYGSVGVQVSSMAEALGMRVLFYDTEYVMNYGRAKAVPTLGELLNQSDIVSVHVPAQTANILGENELRNGMRKGSYLLDISQSAAVDRHALVSALKEGLLNGAALDLPADASPITLPECQNLLVTHNVRHATQEVADAVAKGVVTDLLSYLDHYQNSLTKALSSDIGIERTLAQTTLAK